MSRSLSVLFTPQHLLLICLCLCVVGSLNQATTDNSGPRTVEVEVELGGKGGSFLIVRDNGKGMNASDLKDFATYFLTQVSRSISRPDHAPQQYL